MVKNRLLDRRWLGWLRLVGLLVLCCLMTTLYYSKMAMDNSPFLDDLLRAISMPSLYRECPVAMFDSRMPMTQESFVFSFHACSFNLHLFYSSELLMNCLDVLRTASCGVLAKYVDGWNKLVGMNMNHIPILFK